MILARGKTATYRSGSAPRRLIEVIRKMEAPMTPGTEDDFKTQKTNVKRGSTSGQTCEVDIRFRRNTRLLGSKWRAILSREMR